MYSRTLRNPATGFIIYIQKIIASEKAYAHPFRPGQRGGRN
jgi:hypothetical protein